MKYHLEPVPGRQAKLRDLKDRGMEDSMRKINVSGRIAALCSVLVFLLILHPAVTTMAREAVNKHGEDIFGEDVLEACTPSGSLSSERNRNITVVQPKEGEYRYTKNDAVSGQNYALYVVDGLDGVDDALNWDALKSRLRYVDQKKAEGIPLTFDIPQKELAENSTFYIGDGSENKNYVGGFLTEANEAWVGDLGSFYYSDEGLTTFHKTEYKVTSGKSWEELMGILPDSAFIKLRPRSSVPESGSPGEDSSASVPGQAGSGYDNHIPGMTEIGSDPDAIAVPVSLVWNKPADFTEFDTSRYSEVTLSANVSARTDTEAGRAGEAWAEAFPMPGLTVTVKGPGKPGPKPIAYHEIRLQSGATATLGGQSAISAVPGDEIIINWGREHAGTRSFDGYEFVRWSLTGALPQDPESPHTSFVMGDMDVTVQFTEKKVLEDGDSESPEEEPADRDRTTKLGKLRFANAKITLFKGRSEANPAAATPMKGAESVPEVVYVTENKDIVTVGKDGTFYAKNPGEAIVTAFCGNKKAVCKVTVLCPVEKISILDSEGRSRPDVFNQETFFIGWNKEPENTIMLRSGEQMALRTAFYPYDSTDPRKVTWKVVSWPDSSKGRDRNGNLVYKNDNRYVTVKNGIITAKEATEPNYNPVLVSATVKRTVTDPKTGKIKNVDLTSMVQVYVFPLIPESADNKADLTHTLSVKKNVKIVSTEENNTFDLGITLSSRLKNDTVADSCEILACESSNPDIVSVDGVSALSSADGKGKKATATAWIRANNPGTAYITVKSRNKTSTAPNVQLCKVTVASPVERISAESGTLKIEKDGDRKTLTMRKGSCGILEAAVSPFNTTDLGSLKISGSGGVKVKNGVVWASALTKPGKPGTITVSCGKKVKDTVYITVVKKEETKAYPGEAKGFTDGEKLTVSSFIAPDQPAGISGPTLFAGEDFYGADKILSVTLSGAGSTDETGFIAEAFVEGKAKERRFDTRTGSGEVAFDAFTRNDLFDFWVLAVDKDTLAPVCDPLTLHRKLMDADVQVSSESSVTLTASKDGEALAIKAVAKDLILAGWAMDDLAALDTETVIVEYTDEVASSGEVDGEGTAQEPKLVSENKLERMTRYDAISYSKEARKEAADRLESVRVAYGKLKTSAAVLYSLAGTDKAKEQEARYLALQAGDIATAVLDSAVEIETDLSMKAEDREHNDSEFLATIESMREAAAIVRLCGGAGVLSDGLFGIYPKGAEMALVADAASSAIILYPDNGKAAEGAVMRTDEEGNDKPENSINTEKVFIIAGEIAGEIETPNVRTGPSFTRYEGFTESVGGVQSKKTAISYREDIALNGSVMMALSDYSEEYFNIAGNGTYETWEQMENAFISSADDTEETLRELAGGDLDKANEDFSGAVETEYNVRRGYEEYWEGADTGEDFDKLRFARHYTKDDDGNFVGTYEIYSYGQKTYELYYSSPVSDLNVNGFPDTRAGCVYEKIWEEDQEGNRYLAEEYEYSDSGSPVVENPSYPVDGVSSVGMDGTLAGTGESLGATGASGRSTSYVDEDAEGMFRLYGKPGIPTVHACHYKGHAYYALSQRNVESYGIYNPKRWESIVEERAKGVDPYDESLLQLWMDMHIYCYDILWQKEWLSDGTLEFECKYVGLVPGTGWDDWVFANKYDTTANPPMLEHELKVLDQHLSRRLYVFFYVQNHAFGYCKAKNTYYTPKYFDDERESRVPEDKRPLFYGHLRHYETIYKAQRKDDIVGDYFLGSWEDPPEGQNPIFCGADSNTWPVDDFLQEGHDDVVGVFHWVRRYDETDVPIDIISKAFPVYRTDGKPVPSAD